MIEYYKNLIKKSKNKNHLKYYNEMIEFLINKDKKNNKKIKGKISVYVGCLNKTFSSGSSASKALGKNRNYALNVINGKYPNNYDIRLV